jgi:hypothetical protein
MIAMIFRQYCARYLVFTAHCLGAGAIWKTQEAFLRIFTGWQLKAGNTTSKKPAEKPHQHGNNTRYLTDDPAPEVSELARAGRRSGPGLEGGYFRCVGAVCVWGCYAAQRRASLLTTTTGSSFELTYGAHS